MVENTIETSAPGKVILCGEHAVVHGYPAIAASIDLRTTIRLSYADDATVYLPTLISNLPRFPISEIDASMHSITKGKVRLSSSTALPIGTGLGSSASFAAALSAALLFMQTQQLDLEEINQLAYKFEKTQHGTPSGIDSTTSVYGGVIRYQKQELRPVFTQVKIAHQLPQLFLLQTGVPKETTKEMIAFVREEREKNTRKIDRIFASIGEIADRMEKLLQFKETGEELEQLFSENERLLEELGVVGDKAKSICRELERLGAIVKICGGGGKKRGSGIALVLHPEKEVVTTYAKRQNLDIYDVQLGEDGVRKDDLQ